MPVTFQKKIIYPLIALVIAALANYFIFDYLFLHESEQRLSSWLESETLDLQQGNVMSAFSKFDRVISYRSDIKSIALVKVETGGGLRTLMGIGPSTLSTDAAALRQSKNGWRKQIGLFDYLVATRIPTADNLYVLANIDSKTYQLLLLLNLIIVASILLFVTGWQDQFLRAQEKNRMKFLDETIREIISSDSTSMIPPNFNQQFNSNELRDTLLNLHSEILERNKTSATNLLAKQVAHDIRSPLSALNMMVTSLDSLSDEQRSFLKTVSRRINDIANNLLQKNDPVVSRDIRISKIVSDMVSEKRHKLSDRKDIRIESSICDGSHLSLSEISSAELSRALSNLIDNSAEAGATEVKVAAIRHGNLVTLKVSDNGRGIPAASLSRIGTVGFSLGKINSTSGSGLGVAHAKSFVESAGGSFHIESTEGLGTKVRLELPVSTKTSN